MLKQDMPNSRIEKRAYPRTEGSFPVTVRGKGFTLVTEAKSISCSGLYCKVRESTFLSGEVRVILLLNERSLLGASARFGIIDAGGVIVRSDPELEESAMQISGIAIQFRELSKRDRKRISKYVNE